MIMYTKLSNAGVQALINSQLNEWEQAKNNYAALSGVEVKEFLLNSFPIKVQFNSARIVSSAAKVDVKSIKERKCFLCWANRPANQKGIEYEGNAGIYDILVNPFPIFPKHLTIPDRKHINQTIGEEEGIKGRYEDMLDLAAIIDDYILFYNGPKCGASAPDHMHFQAGNKGFLPIETNFKDLAKEQLYKTEEVEISAVDSYIRGAILIESVNKVKAIEQFNRVYSKIAIKEGECEPLLNLIVWSEKGTCGEVKWNTFIFIREKHRPSHYFAQGDENILLSPASVDLGGVFITPLEKDFRKIGIKEIREILDEISVSSETMDIIKNSIRNQPSVSVGIMTEKEFEFVLNDKYLFSAEEFCESNSYVIGEQKAIESNGKVLWNGNEYKELLFTPKESGTFWLRGVTIGVNFHWERKEDEKFENALKIIVENGKLTAINLIGIEDYLTSVISSEMSATASEELLKAHAVISRSWLLAQINKNTEIKKNSSNYLAYTQTEDELIKWYDREDHVNFDVCADDHCQRYQGLTRASTPKVRAAITKTWGELLTYNGNICDARFSKCCGGVVEEFKSCWEPVNYKYLVPLRDSTKSQDYPNLTIEVNAEEWIMQSPNAFCNTTNKNILGQVLNNYDQETTNFYRWTQKYSQKELSNLILNRSGIDYGEIIDLIPIERGPSGRLIKLKIVGTKKIMTIGKELEIRRTLSTSHLYSSAFVIRKEGVITSVNGNKIPSIFILHGAGWGHGVGLCQIGAAVMGEQGFKYKDILLHYYVGANIEKRY